MTMKLKLIAAALTASVAVLGVTQLASAQTAPNKALPSVSSALAQAQPADIAEAGDTPDVAGQTETADVPEAGDVVDAAEPAGAADTEQQDGDQGGPETPDAPASASK